MDDCGLDASLPSLRYAESDARALHRLLTDSVTGTFEPADAHLRVGAEADAQSLRSLLRTVAVDSTRSDTLLIYFAGHALTADWNGVADDYLVTPDLPRAALRAHPDEGLRMAFLRNEVLDRFNGAAFLVLDCCRAGSFLEARTEQIEMMAIGGRHSKQHSVLTASPKNGSARESATFGHGVVTKHIIDALSGRAADDEGRVTFARMADYVVGQDIDPSPGQFVQSRGATTVLTRPGLAAAGAAASMVDPLPADVRVVELANPLERAAGAILELLSRVYPRAASARGPASSTTGAFGAAGRQPPPLHDKTELLRAAMEADAAAVLEYTTSGFQTITATTHFHEDDLHQLLRGAASSALRGRVLDGTSAGRVLCVPLRHGSATSLELVVVNPAPALLEIGEPLVKILETIWRTNVGGPVEEGEIEVLTALRTSFGRLPSRLYDRCYELYRAVVGSFAMVFQPIVTIDRLARNVEIHSYEALARLDPADSRAPVDLIRHAHVWGDRFVVERDQAILHKAIQAYDDAHRRCHGDSGVPRPVSINVAVRSLLDDSYVDAIERTIAGAGLRPGAVTLEISEQDPIAPRIYESWGDDSLAYFHQRLVEIAGRLDIRFAVDDFGVGHSSVSRMAELPLTQIKVDRALLRHPLAHQELALVADVARHPLKMGYAPAARSVVVEGVEDDSPITLEQIYGIGIRHVQGYVTGERPASTIKREIGQEMREHIASLVRGDRGRNPLRRTA
ncbi:EAL domain-containing protein [Asanoa sp. WMMD1127]|uniref:EAL domain-containing protein n=1 Tax=Asanoa sp. WMMD1127 TaxID=3016107 RepID=UPI003242D317